MMMLKNRKDVKETKQHSKKRFWLLRESKFEWILKHEGKQLAMMELKALVLVHRKNRYRTKWTYEIKQLYRSMSTRE